MSDLREQLAALAHEQWSGWMTSMFSKCQGYQKGGQGVHIPQPWADRWVRQLNTLYADLSEEEKGCDRKEADRVLALIEAAMAAPEEIW